MSADLRVELCGYPLRNPFVLASGIWGSCAETLVRAALDGAAAVTAKSCSLERRRGHENPTVLPWSGGLINAVGLSNPGAEATAEMLAEAKTALAPTGSLLIASVFGETAQSFSAAAAVVAKSAPHIIEVNISCPNVAGEFGEPFAFDPEATRAVTRAVRNVYDGPLLVKLSPSAPRLVSVGNAALSAGADGLTMGNTLGPGMLIDVAARCPVLTNRVGGVSGDALRPVALRCVFDLWAATGATIVGVGGVSAGDHAMQLMMAGATAVGVGSAIYAEGSGVFGRLARELDALMSAEGFDEVSFVGCAHSG